MKHTCEFCYYADELSEGAVVCRRYPPTITKVEGTTVTSHFPFVNKDAWCGEGEWIDERDS